MGGKNNFKGRLGLFGHYKFITVGRGYSNLLLYKTLWFCIVDLILVVVTEWCLLVGPGIINSNVLSSIQSSSCC